MGTSASSAGPGGGVPMVPPWVPDAGTPQGTPSPQTLPAGTAPPATVAPVGRFRGARTNLGSFAATGSSRGLRRGLGHYVRTGSGGAAQATRRMGGTVRNAGVLYGVLDALRSGTAPPVPLGFTPASMAGRPARETADRIAEAISPPNGTLDAEASRDSMARAFAELIRRDPLADLGALTEAQVGLVVELYLANDLCRRIELDIGKAVWDKAPDPAAAMRRLEEVRSFVAQAVSNAFRSLVQGVSIGAQNAARISEQVLHTTFKVFESYV